MRGRASTPRPERLAFGACEPIAGAARPSVPGPRGVPARGGMLRGFAPPARQRTDYAYLGLLAFTAVLFLRPQDKLPFLGALHLAELSALGGLVAMIIQRVTRGLAPVRFTREVLAVLAFGGVIVATLPFSIWPGGALELLLDVYVKVILIFILMVTTLSTLTRLMTFAWVIVLGSGYISALAMLDYVRGFNLVENGRLGGAVSGSVRNPNDLALNMVAFLPLATLLAVRSPRASSRALAAVVGLSMLATVILTKSRSGFIGLVVMTAVLLLVADGIKRGLRVGIVVTCLAALPVVPASFWNRMASITDSSEDETGSREARRRVAQEAWRTFLEHPLTGVGAGQFTNYNPPWRQERWREAHDVALQVAADLGLPGLLVFLVLVWTALAAALSSRSAARRAVRAGPTAGAAWILRFARRPSDGRSEARQPAPAAPSSQRRTEAAGLHAYATAACVSFAGWLACALFASVAYNWTFYYVLGLSVATRNLAAGYTRRAGADLQGPDENERPAKLDTGEHRVRS